MSNSLNEVKLIGNLTADPEMRQTPNGQFVANFSIATSRIWKDAQGEKQEASDFHNIVIWGKLAEIVEKYLSKGKKVYVSGRLGTRSWEDQNGNKKYKTEIIADDMILLTPKDKSSSTGDAFDEDPLKPAKKKNKIPTEEIQIEDIPF